MVIWHYTLFLVLLTRPNIILNMLPFMFSQLIWLVITSWWVDRPNGIRYFLPWICFICYFSILGMTQLVMRNFKQHFLSDLIFTAKNNCKMLLRSLVWMTPQLIGDHVTIFNNNSNANNRNKSLLLLFHPHNDCVEKSVSTLGCEIQLTLATCTSNWC